ncbi:transposase (plasmid) [Methylobacterium indicum]|uniref:Transposase n=2 Tax=Methylobacterium indicum TaxID=1775910 RepID=A0A8H9C9A6_9HYPH|nr:transposase [Methylobacterium indicum]
MDEARVGQKGRSGHRWWMRGQRPAGRCDGRFQSAYIFAAVEPQTGSAFGLVLPRVSTEAMSLFLAQFAATLEPDTQAVVVLDGAGWHIAKDLRVPDAVTLVRLPAYSPELNPVERIWLYLRERFLSARVFPDYEAILDACCTAWNALTAEPERVRSIANFPYIARVNA